MNRLRFTPYVWAKMKYLRDIGDTEVSFMGISSLEDPGLVYDVQMVPQEDSAAYTEFKDDGLADFFDRMVDAGRQPAEFGRIWCHTHPGSSASPSGTDEETFKRVFGHTDWAVMFILAKGNQTTCRLKFNVGPGAAVNLDVEVDYTACFPAVSRQVKEAWKAEYEANWSKRVYQNWSSSSSGYSGSIGGHGSSWKSAKGTIVCQSDGIGHCIFAGKRWTWEDYRRLSYEEKQRLQLAYDNAQEAEERKRSPLGLYTGSAGNGKLTRRAKKYFKQHGTLVGFTGQAFVGNHQPVLPAGNGKLALPVKTEKLDSGLVVARGIRYDQNDDDWLEEVFEEWAAEKGLKTSDLTEAEKDQAIESLWEAAKKEAEEELTLLEEPTNEELEKLQKELDEEDAKTMAKVNASKPLAVPLRSVNDDYDPDDGYWRPTGRDISGHYDVLG